MNYYLFLNNLKIIRYIIICHKKQIISHKNQIFKNLYKMFIKDLEQKVNPKSVIEGINILTTIEKTNDQSILLKPMQDGANEFKKRVGRNMT